MKLTGIMTAVALTAGVALATPASAVTIPLTKTATGASVATWNVTQPSAGAFLNTFTFVLPAAGKVTLSLTSLATSAATNVNFNMTNVKFNGVVLPVISRGTFELRTLVDQAVNGGTSTLVVQGSSGAMGSYTGTITYAIPEPAMWALMILGFGFTGAALRTRRRQVTFAAA